MQTKQELTNQINALVSEYLGFETQDAGLKKLNKAQLAKRLAHYQEMMRLHRECLEARQAYTSNEWITEAMRNTPAFKEINALRRKVHDMWQSPPIR